MKASPVDFDVGIIGGGPAGSCLASYLARAGVTCVVLEKELHPRPHVGESLIPTSNRIFREIGFLEQMESNGFVKKYGTAWRARSGSKFYEVDFQRLELPDYHLEFTFAETPSPGSEQSYSYHVDRSKFDLLMLQHCHRLGAKVYEGVAVSRVEFPEGDLPVIRFALGAREAGLRVKIVVDASGRQTVLGNQLRLKVMDPIFDQYALHTWFEGYDRGAGPKRDYIVSSYLPLANSWIWQIPISETVTSIGVVTQKKHFVGSRQRREEFFRGCLAQYPDIDARIKAARQLRPLKEEADYSYAMKRICGDHFLLLGDAARFIDPVFSSGISIALNGARMAQEDIRAALQSGDFRRQAFSRYETRALRGIKNWHAIISMYYRLNFLFTIFTQDPVHRKEAIRLFQGDVYDEDEPAVLKEMRKIIDEVEADPNHVWHRYLGELTSKTFDPALYGAAAAAP